MKKIGKFLLYLLTAAMVSSFFVIGVAWTCANINDYDEYHRLEHTAVQVTATITRVEEHESDDSTDYWQYISYTHEGRTYSDIFYKSSSKSNVLGKKVTVYIDPEQPDHLRPDNPGLFVPIIACLFMVPGTFFPVWLLGSELAKAAAVGRWPEHYGYGILSEDRVREDILFERARTQQIRRSIAWGLLLAALIGSLIYMYMRGTATAFYGFLPPTVLNLLATLRFAKVKEPQISLVETQYEGVVKEKDDEGALVSRRRFSGLSTQLMTIALVSLQGISWDDVQQGTAFYAARVDGRVSRFFPASEFRKEKI